MNKYFIILMVLISADSFGLISQDENIHSEYASADLLNSEINTEFIMFKPIPNFPNYQFNNETLEVKSLGRVISNKRGEYEIPERILKPIKTRDGYYMFSLLNENGQRTVKRSQISWLVNTGALPQKPLQIDHINNDKTEDRFWNLQLLTNRQNTTKAKAQFGARLPAGVYWCKRDKIYRAQIQVRGKTISLGSYKSVDDASLSYQTFLTNEVIK